MTAIRRVETRAPGRHRRGAGGSPGMLAFGGRWGTSPPRSVIATSSRLTPVCWPLSLKRRPLRAVTSLTAPDSLDPRRPRTT